MVDSRKVLNSGYELKIGNGINCVIESVIGRGANCLVYNAFYIDQVNAKHTVRIKEFFPIYLNIKRNLNGELTSNESVLEQFEEAKKKFINSYKRNVEFRGISGLVNSTSNVHGIYEINCTCYLVASYDEGVDYKQYEDACLKETLQHIKALAEIIKKYHDSGYLHLDIKPENILILPETAEHVILFDFDSIFKIEEQSMEKYEISYSDGFSSPEQIHGKMHRIGKHSDVYSIGALFFFKIFGRVPKFRDICFGAKFSFDDFKFENEIFPPKFFKLLECFLNKTLALSASMRWKGMEEVIDLLDEMIPLADQNRSFVLSNFVYHESCFIGRSKEIEEIKNKLKHLDAVFLSGMGGVGKTELARRYAYINRNSYDTIIFLRFSSSIEETIASDELQISNFECDKGDDISKIYQAKMEYLKKTLTKNDLIILDNFDVDIVDDEKVLDLLEVPCKFIITTRVNDIREYNYEQIDIDSMRDEEYALKLFSVYNYKHYEDYSKMEQNSIKEIIRLIDYHTMTIELLGKYIAHSREKPSVLYKKFLTKKGVTNTNDTKVKHRKDKRINFKEVKQHLKILFDFSKFSSAERRLLINLSLLGEVRIQKKLFFDIIDSKEAEECFENLRRRGWIEVDYIGDENEKISLHQIILDLLYNDEIQRTENFTDFFGKMAVYFQKNENNDTIKIGKKKLAEIFINRIEEKQFMGFHVSKVFLEYCRNIKYNPQLLDKAEKKCLEDGALDSIAILADIKILKLKKLQLSVYPWDVETEELEISIKQLYKEVDLLKENIFDLVRQLIIESNDLKYDSSRNDEMYFINSLKENPNFDSELDFWASLQGDSNCKDIVSWIDFNNTELEKIKSIYFKIDFKKQFEKGYPISDYMTENAGRILLDTALAIVSLVNNICEEGMILENASELGFPVFFLDAEKILLYLFDVIMQTKADYFSYVFKEKLLNSIIEFYGDGEDDFLTAAQGSCVLNINKSVYFSSILKKLRLQLEQKAVKQNEVSYYMAGDKAMEQGNYEQALKLYKMALENKECEHKFLQYRICHALIHLKKYDEAEQILLKVAQNDKESNYDPCATYRELEYLYEKSLDIPSAIKYCDQIVQYKKSLKKLDEQQNAISWLLKYQGRKINLKNRLNEYISDEEYSTLIKYSKKIFSYYEIDTMIVDGFIELHKKVWEKENTQEIIEIIYNAAKRYRLQRNYKEAEQIYTCLIEDCQVKLYYKNIYIRSLLWLAQMYIDMFCDDHTIPIRCIREAEQIIKENDADYKYFCAKIKKIKIRIPDLDDWIELINTCNYYLISEKEIKECEVRSAFSEWNSTIHEYFQVNYDNQFYSLATNESIKDYSKYEQKEMLLKSLKCLTDEFYKSSDYYKTETYCNTILEWYLCNITNTTISMFEGLVEFFFENVRKKVVKEHENIGILYNLAEGAIKLKYIDHAISLYFMSIRALLNYRKYINLVNDESFSWILRKDFEKEFDLLFLDFEYEGRRIDYALKILQKIMDDLQNFEEYEVLCKKIQNVKYGYETMQIEIKR